MSQIERRLAAIMFTDLVGYTALTQKNESLALELLNEHRKITRRLFAEYGGREIKTIGDAFLVVFASALEAVRCAFEIQKSLHDLNSERPLERRIQLRIGIHLGDVIHEQDDVYGDAVNVASRIESLAPAGGICLTEEVYAQIKNKFELPLSSLGSKNLKNVTDKVEIFQVVLPWEKEAAAQLIPIDRHRIAILPFTSMSPDPNDEFFADGLTEELIARLSLLKGLEVIARTSVMNYKKKEKNASQIGSELRAGTLVEGSVRKAGNKIRVTAQLIDSRSESHLWAESYDRNLEDIFAVQSDVAEKVASSLHLKLTDLDRKKIDSRETSNVDAYMEYMKGLVNSSRWEKKALETAIAHYERAIKLDPRYVLAYCGLAGAYAMLGFQDLMKSEVAFERSEHFARKAMELDDSIADSHLALAISQGINYDFEGRERDFKKAVELNPNLADAHEALSSIYAFTGRWDECLREVDKAVELDPLSVHALRNAGTWYLYAGNYDRAAELLSEALEISPSDSFALDNLGLAQIKSGNIADGLAKIRKASEMSGGTAFYGDLAYAYAKSDQPGEARKVLDSLLNDSEGRSLSATKIAGIYAILNEKENAMTWLETAYHNRSGYLPSVATDFIFENLRGYPPYETFVSKMGLNKHKI